VKVPPVREAFVGYGYVVGGVATGAYLLTESLADDYLLLGSLGASTRTALYVSLATTSGALFGFAITAITVILSVGSGRAIDFLRSLDEYSYVRKVLMGAITSLAIATIVFTAMIVLDPGKHGRLLLQALVVGILAWVICRVAGVVWLLNRLLRLTLRTDEKGTSAGGG
jgi:hypothetical protein